MEFQDVVRRRRMVRAFSDEPVARAQVERLLANAVRGPSAGFTQGWAFLVLESPEDRGRFWAAASPEPRPAGALAGLRAPAGSPEPRPTGAFASLRAPGESPEPTRDLSAWKAGMRRAPLIVVPMASRDAYLQRYAERDKVGARLATPGAWTPEDEARWPVPYWHVDVGMASLLMLQTAVDLGLGACFFGIGGPERPAFRAAFEVPAEWEPTGAIAVGHPDSSEPGAPGSPARRRRKPLDEVVHRSRW